MTRIELGQIVAAHGVNGHVVVRSHTQVPEDIAAYGTLTDDDGARRFDLAVVRVSAKGVVVRIAGVTNRTAAEALRGVRLYVDRARLPAAAPGEYYHSDLIGLSVVTADGRAAGEVVAVHNFGAGDILEIRRSRSSRTEMIPFTTSFVPDVDVAQRRITVSWPAEPNDESADA